VACHRSFYTYNDTDGHWVKTVMDGFGRTIQTITGYGTTTVSTADTQYAPCGCSPLGKLSKQSQPYAPGGSDAWTVYHYDASGRTTSVVLPDNSTTMYSYNGAQVVATDPAGLTKSFTMDAFGNLVDVGEIDPALGLVQTTYTYDVLNHLTNVNMTRGTHTQTRTFNYNKPSTTVTAFLQSATNPENGTVTYTYNSGTTNTLASKTDAKGQKLTYEYDTLNRLTSITNATGGGSQVLRTYNYDFNPLPGYSPLYALGRLAMVQYTQVPTGHGNVQLYESYAYAPPNSPGAGLPSRKELRLDQTLTDANCNPTAVVSGFLDTYLSYNGEGELTEIRYPNTVTGAGGPDTTTRGPIYDYTYDSMNRLSGMT